jgi:diaminohydroxyphosphoribosylaminopyrimidine deaminase / 5-amino-6-(5-phosphoribosylamino)uracil reductase
LTGQSTTPGDSEFLRRALALAEGGRGKVSPNPLVGAVVVRDGKVIGEGFHAALGGLHGERAALADAARRGEDVAGATMYVTLEPCAHQGRQPPCSDALIEARIGRVVIASDDLTEKAAGKGPAQLREAGVEVEFIEGADTRRAESSDPEVAAIAKAARLLNQPFRKSASRRMPWVLLKTAMSLDGRTATPAGDSPWISGEPARELVHEWRAECDAIAVGIGTVLEDDPLLTARGSGALPVSNTDGTEGPDAPRQPTRVVFDSRARLPLDSRLLATVEGAPLVVVAGPEAEVGRLEALRERGAQTLLVGGKTPGNRVEAALTGLGRLGITSLMLEGGATLIAAFAEAEEIDQARVFVAPLLLGGPAPDAPSSTRLGGALIGAEVVGRDTLIRTLFKEY